jgi:hypothetical protein
MGLIPGLDNIVDRGTPELVPLRLDRFSLVPQDDKQILEGRRILFYYEVGAHLNGYYNSHQKPHPPLPRYHNLIRQTLHPYPLNPPRSSHRRDVASLTSIMTILLSLPQQEQEEECA